MTTQLKMFILLNHKLHFQVKSVKPLHSLLFVTAVLAYSDSTEEEVFIPWFHL